jgi:hypothetical protein
MTTHDLELIISKIDTLDAKLDKHIQDEENRIGELVEAWKTAKGIVWFVKITAGVVASLAIGWAWISNHFVIGVK